jgi:membrane protease YdiL (CAAX protease family)
MTTTEIVEPASGRRVLWCEVGAVLAIGMLPDLANALTWLALSAKPMPYWLDALNLSCRSVCVSVAVLFIMFRSGESWAEFGLKRPRLSDLFLGVFLLVAHLLLWALISSAVPLAPWKETFEFSLPHSRLDYALMVLACAANGFAEELVMRAYLLTRMDRLLGSGILAIGVSAVFFASYHAYQGPPGIAHALMIGLLYGSYFGLAGRIWPCVVAHMLCNVTIYLSPAG